MRGRYRIPNATWERPLRPWDFREGSEAADRRSAGLQAYFNRKTTVSSIQVATDWMPRWAGL